MSGNDKNISVYSASDIQKYLRGELSAREMHQLELAALEDPMLSDALEGMAIHPSLPSSSSIQQDLGELQQRLDSRVSKEDTKGAVLFFRSPMKAAAVLILLVGLGLTTYFLFFMGTAKFRLADSEKQKSLPVTTNPATADSTVGQNQDVASNQPPAPTADKSATKEPQASKAKGDLSSTQKQFSSPAVASSSASAPSADKLPGRIKDNEKETGDDDLAKIEKAAEVAAAKKVTSPPVPGAYKSHITTPADQLVFSGKVIDQNKRPLPGAAVYMAGNYLPNTTTDKNGNFSLKLPKNDSTLKLTVGYVGYEQASLGLSTDNRTGNVIQLQPQAAAMNEVVVTGYGAKRSEILQNNSKPKKQSLPTKAEPVIGWPAYEIYLDVNKKMVDPDSTLKGSETISFLVNEKGALSSFKVEQSLSPAHDSAAIHLIQQGPSWKLLKGRRTRAWVTIPF